MLAKQLRTSQKRQKDRFLSKILGTLGTKLLENLFTGKGVKANIPGSGVIRAGEETIRVGGDF